MKASFTRDGPLLTPSASAVSPWSDDMVNGHHVGGLVAWGALRDHGDPDMQLTRLTVDMFRPVPMKPLEVRTALTRAGRRIRVVETTLLHDGIEVAKGSVLLLARSEDPEGASPWAEDAWDAPPPEDLPYTASRHSMVSWEILPLGGMDAGGRRRAWVRELTPLVEGEELAPVLRACLAADYTNPLVNMGSDGLGYINADVTIYLARDPVDDWVGLESRGHTRSEGIALGGASVHDRLGRIGEAIVAAIPDERLRQRRLGDSSQS